jgi:2,4-dienoyl-CoA reductase-like NADH-dependent reductase (Old Yellow Enzyme family)
VTTTSSNVHDLASRLELGHGPAWTNRIALAPLTNMQSNPDGTLHDHEYKWLVRRGEGGFGMVMTGAAHVSVAGQAFPGQLGTCDDEQLPGLPRGTTRLGVAGRILDGTGARECLERGADFVLVGTAGILHHDFARRVIADPSCRSLPQPVSADHLLSESVGPAFLNYLATNWDDFVA